MAKKGENKYFDIHAPVFYPAAIIILTTILVSFFYSESLVSSFGYFQEKTSEYAGWFFIVTMNIFVVAALWFAFSKFGKIRLGGPKARPQFSTFAWFSMLFSAGLGIGLMFYGVAEPMFHYENPPLPVDTLGERAENAMLFTFLHYGFHGWAPYVIVGLALAFFTFNKGYPLTISSLFRPLIGNMANGFLGHVINVIAVIATVFGLATTLGIGVQQIGSGLEFLFGIENTTQTHVILIIIITLAATASVVLGLDKGVRILSVLNMRLALLFLIFILFIGPTSFILDGLVQNVGNYLNSLIKIGTWAETYQDNNWQHDWTIFYWAWWISWSPFVGMFIARVSKGRTVKEFILGVLLVPSLLVFVWMSVFGGAAIFVESQGLAPIAQSVSDDLSTALFVLLQEFPLSSVTSFVGIVLVTIFFVTSSDSGSLVIDSITSGGKLDAPVGQRIFWALLEGGVAASLLFAGGLKALQSAVISAGLPFAIIILLIIYSLAREFTKTSHKMWLKAKEKERKAYLEQLKNIINSEEDED
jgi:choline/glycine/proline betaine transport protein|nr:BCCT family transporter [uncultured Allomuricauda sp.]